MDVWTRPIRFSPSCLALSGLRVFCYPAPGLRPLGLALGWYVKPLRGTMAAHLQNIKALGFASETGEKCELTAGGVVVQRFFLPLRLRYCDWSPGSFPAPTLQAPPATAPALQVLSAAAPETHPPNPDASRPGMHDGDGAAWAPSPQPPKAHSRLSMGYREGMVYFMPQTNRYSRPGTGFLPQSAFREQPCGKRIFTVPEWGKKVLVSIVVHGDARA